MDLASKETKRMELAKVCDTRLRTINVLKIQYTAKCLYFYF